jgi:hypothetical protein
VLVPFMRRRVEFDVNDLLERTADSAFGMAETFGGLLEPSGAEQWRAISALRAELTPT